MKKRTKALALVFCAVLLVTASVLGTMAYLTSQDSVENSFTIGNVKITLDEAKTTTDGQLVANSPRVKANEYHLLPGHTYVKDPTVHVNATSENCWVFVKVENAISAYEGTTTIASQITTNGWTALTGQSGVYYKTWTKGSATDLPVFGNFTIATNADTVSGWSSISATTTKVKVTAYAIQMDGIATAAAAWTALNPTSGS